VLDDRKVGEAGRLQMTTEEITAICDEAHKVGMMVAIHGNIINFLLLFT
jgi:imidazolonepropionase-like amidohydrolase